MVDGMLNFPDTSYLLKVLASLDLEIKVANNEFRERYSSLGDEAYNNMFDSLGLNEQQPLINFESALSFVSMRSEISAAHELWLENDGENDELNPNRHFIVDNTVRAILNKYGEVKIGNTFFTFTEEGYSEFTDFQTLIKQRGQKTNDQNRISISCESNKRNNGSEPINSTKKYDWVVSHYTYPWGKYVVAKLDNYEKKGRRWRRYKEESLAQVFGDISDLSGNCNSRITFNSANGAYVADKDQEVKHKIAVFSNTSPSWVLGYWSVKNKNKTKPLSW